MAKRTTFEKNILMKDRQGKEGRKKVLLKKGGKGGGKETGQRGKREQRVKRTKVSNFYSYMNFVS